MKSVARMTLACDGLEDMNFCSPTANMLQSGIDSKMYERTNLRVVTVSTRTDRTGQDSTESASPVKRLITMYNTNGSTAQKGCRRLRANSTKNMGESVNYAPVIGEAIGENDQWFFSAIGGLIDSEENTPRENESDTESDWSPDKIRDILNKDDLLRTNSETKVASAKKSLFFTDDENEIIWEV